MPPRLTGSTPAKTAKPVMLKHAFLKPTPAQRAAKADAAAAAERKRQEALQAKRNDAIFAKRQDAAEKKVIQERVAAQHGLAPVRSLGQKDKAKIKGEADPGLLASARTRTQRLTHGGLLSDAQRLDEYLGQQEVASSRHLRLSDRDMMPQNLTVPGGLTTGRTPPDKRDRPAPKFVKGRGLGSNIAEQSRPTLDIGSRYKGLHLNQAAEQTMGMLAPGLGLGRTVNEWVTKALPGALGTGHPATKATVLKKWLDPTAQGAVPKGQERVPLSDLSDTQKYGEYSLGTPYRKYLTGLAVKNGYNEKDVLTWNDPQLIARAFIPNEKSVTGFFRNAAQDAANQAALLNAPAMMADTIGKSIQQRSPQPLFRQAGQLAEGFIQLAPFVGDRPWLENLYEKPVGTTLTVAPAARWAGIRLGRVSGMQPVREVTLPAAARAVEGGLKKPGAERVTIPASEHIGMRAAYALHDALLARSRHPVERARTEALRDTAKNPVLEAGRAVGALPGRAGHALEQRIQDKLINDENMKARLRAGRDPHLAGVAYLKSIRDHPFVKHLMKGWGGQERHIERVVVHSGSSVPSDQLAYYYEQTHKDTLGKIEEFKQKAAQAAADGRADDAKAYLKDAKDLQDITAKAQKGKVEFSGEHTPIDPQNMTPEETNLANAARNASRQAGRILEQQGIIDEKGRLFGDWQYRLAVVDKTEGPGMKYGGAEGTPAWHIAQKLIPAREEFLQARAAYHGITGDAGVDEALNLPASRDVRTHVSEHEVGRNRFARQLILRAQQQQARVMERRQRVATRGGNPVGDAISAGVNDRALGRAIQDASGALNQRRAFARTGEHSHNADLAQRIEGQTRDEKAAFQQQARGVLQRKERALESAKIHKRGKTTIDALEKDLQDAVQNLEEGFQPSEDLLGLMRQHEKLNLGIDLYELGDRQVNSIIERNFHGRLQPHQHELVKTAVQDALDRETNYGPQIAGAQRIAEDSAARFRDLTAKDIEVAHRFDRAEALYRRSLRAFRDEGERLGHDPYHLHMHKPDTRYGLQPVRVSAGQQWAEGDYTKDMHFLVARDLEGLSRKAVSGALFKALSNDHPLFIENPPVDSTVPPGWFKVDKTLFDNLQRTSKNADEVEQLMREWRETGATSHEGQLVGENDVLMTRDLKDWIQRELKRSDPENTINPLLRATNTYRRWMLFSLPRTLANNAFGNPILAAVQGAGIRTWYESVWTLRNHPERVMHTLRKKGMSGNVMERPSAKMVGWQAFLRHNNTFAEDNGNLMVYLLHAKRAYKKENGLHWFNRVGRMNEGWGKYLEDAAQGKVPDAFEWQKKATQMFGDMFRTSKYDPALATSFLFHRWVGHMIHLTWWTMPTKYPGRTLFLQQTAYMADEYRKKHGVFPTWAAGYIPLWNELQKAGGLPQNVVWALGTQGVNPFSTSPQSIDLGDVSQQRFPLQSFLAANINPALRIIIEAASGRRLDTLEPFKNHEGDEISGLSARVLANSVIANTPVVNTVFTRAGLSDESIQIPGTFGMWPRFSKMAQYDPTMQPPQAVGHGFLSDLLLGAGRATGVNVRPIDAAGNRTATSARRTIDWQAQQATLRANKKGAADFAEKMKYFQEHGQAAYTKKYGKP